jgi:dienelactone hydrolase
MSAIPGFNEETFDASGYSMRLFRRGEGYGVVLLHELPGLTEETASFAEWLADRDFHVVMPLLFGKPMQGAKVGLLKSPLLCVRREFHCLVAGKSSPLSDSMRALCRKVHMERGGPGVAVIGMCLTGGIVLATLVEPSVLAAVTAQPSLPFFSSEALDVDPLDLRTASRRADRMACLGLRFENDWRCRGARFDRIATELGGSASDGHPRFRSVVVPGLGHATLTFDYDKARRQGVDTRELVVEHLRDRLRDAANLG